MELNILKKNYSELEKKYSLPSFKELNNIFEIEKIENESDLLLRVIRKIMSEKVFNTLNFIEMVYNPQSAPRMYHNYIKFMDSSDKKILDKLYASLSEIVLGSLSLEVESNDSLEADMIKKIYKTWNENKNSLKSMFDRVKNPSKEEIKKEKSYFG